MLEVDHELVLEVPKAELDPVRERVPGLIEGVARLTCRCWWRSGAGTTGMKRTEGAHCRSTEPAAAMNPIAAPADPAC